MYLYHPWKVGENSHLNWFSLGLTCLVGKRSMALNLKLPNCPPAAFRNVRVMGGFFWLSLRTGVLLLINSTPGARNT